MPTNPNDVAHEHIPTLGQVIHKQSNAPIQLKAHR